MKLAVFAFVLINLATGQREVVNPPEARLRKSPYSTYKVVHALIGLEEALLSGAEHVMKWDGVVRQRVECNRDVTLAAAMEHSCLWYFQRLAKELGIGRERAWLKKLDYGNARVEGDVESFWLSGSLHVSVEEAAEIMRRLWKSALPFSPAYQATVRAILPAQRGAHGEWRGKTGSDGRHLSWFVGHLAHDGAEYVFATRVDEPRAARFTARDKTEQLLRARGLWIE